MTTVTDAPLDRMDVARALLPVLTSGPGLDWRELGMCRQVDPEIFFPERGGSDTEAKRICAACQVRPDCLKFALDTGEQHGIWGGLSEKERRETRLVSALPAAS
jgi:WhiB family redox-sensing transcriptional regulator